MPTSSYFDFGIVDNKFNRICGELKLTRTLKISARQLLCKNQFHRLSQFKKSQPFYKMQFICTLTKTMPDKSSSTSPVNYQFFPFMSSVSSLFSSKIDSQPVAEHSPLDSLIDSWKMKRVAIVGDGNCCFSAVAFGIMNTSFTPSLNSIHPELTMSSLEVLSKQLRGVAVKENPNYLTKSIILDVYNAAVEI